MMTHFKEGLSALTYAIKADLSLMARTVKGRIADALWVSAFYPCLPDFAKDWVFDNIDNVI